MSVTIDTTANQYQNRLSKLNDIMDDYRPLLRKVSKLPDDQRQFWIDRDPILRRLIRIGFRVQKLMGQGDEP